MYWILGRKSELSLAKKLVLYKTIVKPIWTYSITIWVSSLPIKYRNVAKISE
jgi:hypothetical protein